MARNLRHLPRGELGVEIFGKLLTFLGQSIDFFCNVDR